MRRDSSAAIFVSSIIIVTPFRTLPTPRKQADDRDEERGPDDRPDDRERLSADVDGEDLSEAEGARQPHSEQRTDEPERDRGEAATTAPARDRLTDRAADSGYD